MSSEIIVAGKLWGISCHQDKPPLTWSIPTKDDLKAEAIGKAVGKFIADMIIATVFGTLVGIVLSL